MKEEVLVGDMIAVVASYPCFDGMGCRTPFVSGGGKNVETARMRKAEFLFLDFTNSLVSGSSSVFARIELFPVVAVVANEVCNLADHKWSTEQTLGITALNSTYLILK